MTTGYLASHPPSINIPFINPDGTVNQTWLLFILSVFQRTGGNTSPTYTLSQLEQLVIIGLSVVKANGFNGIVTSGQNSTLTIETTVTGIIKGDGTALSAATAGIDYGTVSSVGVTVPSSLLSVTPSTITSSGTFAISLTTQASNTLLAGPITGLGTAPTFRGLVSTDIPALNYVSTLTTQGANQILAGPSSGVGAAPTFRSLTTADIPALPYGTGTVTSVGMSVPTALLSVAPSTITTSGSFALSLTTQTSAQIFASPISTVGTPSFRSLVTSDIPALNYVSSTTTQAAHQILAGPITGTAAPTFRSLVSTDIPALPYGTGTVTSVALALPNIMSVSGSPVTTTGTLTGTLTTQAANSLFAGPISGVGATPTFRALTTADIAGLGVGTVTSVGMTVPSILSVTPSTITTSGSFALSLTTESANQIFAGPSSGAAATPTFRSLTSADIPALPYGTVTSVGQSFTGGLISVSGSPVTSSGTLALTVAGTSGGIPYFSSGTNWASSAALTANALMIGGGAGVAPSTTTTGTGVLTALGTSVGTSGAFVTNGGALGTPSSGTVTNLTGTAAINITGTAPAGTLTGTTLNSTVVTSSLTSVGTIGTGTWQGTAIGGGYGGTGQTTYSVGDILYASASTTLSKLSDVATGNALISGGVTTAPSWGKIGLTTHVSGTLPTSSGGTGLSGSTPFTSGGFVYATSSSALSTTTSTDIFTDGTNILLGIASNTYSAKLLVNGRVTFYDSNGSAQFNWIPNKATGTSGSGAFGLGYNAVNFTPASTPNALYWDGNTGYLTILTSSQRYKTNITAITDAQLDMALKLQPSYYQRIGYDYWEYGLIAEQAQSVGLTELISMAEGEVTGVDYSKIGVFAIGLIQRQQKLIDSLTQSVQEIKNILQTKNIT